MSDSILFLVDSPLFGIFLTVLTFVLADRLTKIINKPYITQLFLMMVILITFFAVTGIDLDYYQQGGDMITFLIGPMTIALAMPIYRERHILAEYFIPILGAIAVGAVVALVSGYALGKLVGLDKSVILSLLPKNTTTGIAQELSLAIKGDSPLTIALVIIAGNTGYMFASTVYSLTRIEHPVAKGVALGTSSHAVGTKRALELGETEGAVSSAAIGVAGMITTFLLPAALALMF
ncbi:MAG: LrgB family protein [Peptoniphilus sp.]|nr:LrgB family protein [Peptoniphilus sp.]MDD7362879.1 LrgB family protein [Bacillota bacterium]MDY6044880.1 LrgB family protein [Peptoniphilus sp.]